MKKLIFVFAALLVVGGCGTKVDVSPSVEEFRSERSYFAEEQKQLKDELIVDYIGLDSFVNEVEETFGTPSDVADFSPSSYEYRYDEVEFVLFEDKVKCIGLTSPVFSTESGVNVGQSFDEVFPLYLNREYYVTAESDFLLVVEEDYMMFFVFLANDLHALGLAETEYYEQVGDMTLHEMKEYIASTYENNEDAVYDENDYTYEQSDKEQFHHDSIIGNHDQLYAAIIDGNSEKAIQLVSEYSYDYNELFSPSLHPSPYFQTNFIHTAAYYGDLELVKQMVESGGDIESKDPDGYTVLFKAIQTNKTKMVDYLLEYGADPHYLVYDQTERSMSYSYTPLMMASVYGNLAVIESLLYRGVDVNAQNIFGETALMFAVRNNHIEAASTLIDFGADLWLTENTNRYTVFDMVEHEEEMNEQMKQWVRALH
ncbi:ankyrin repeat domain-containing protein [Alkalihalobacillus sp. LMS39]|uniref:ankyrin repeat domain-containing protein n=1 Tax=Alkalihalobacillus sp. LMS39 TaxID=2924032 RepID=UPI001FB367C2|nr:ankyrin repeat domain-containing protein [Alkalihalobacillus sp. LMS39]UOE94876.1 ankyrin repeat domain-containing protein [Alkalihalobacillus sp. LMS39]